MRMCEFTGCPSEPIGFAAAWEYCVECGREEVYNYYKPFSAPTRCRVCGGRMTDKETEDFRKRIENDLKKHKKQIEKIKRRNMKT